MYLVVNEYVEIGKNLMYLAGNIYHILVFFLIVLVVYGLYRLFNIFF